LGVFNPLQERFDIGQECKISRNKTKEIKFEIGEIVYIIETGRHDYLVKNNKGIKDIVYQFELNQL